MFKFNKTSFCHCGLDPQSDIFFFINFHCVLCVFLCELCGKILLTTKNTKFYTRFTKFLFIV